MLGFMIGRDGIKRDLVQAVMTRASCHDMVWMQILEARQAVA